MFKQSSKLCQCPHQGYVVPPTTSLYELCTTHTPYEHKCNASFTMCEWTHYKRQLEHFIHSEYMSSVLIKYIGTMNCVWSHLGLHAAIRMCKEVCICISNVLDWFKKFMTDTQ